MLRSVTAISAEARSARRNPWPWVVIAVAVTVGLGLVMAAFELGRQGARPGDPTAEGLFWLGLICVLVAPTAGILRDGASGGERFALVCLTGLGLYIVKVLRAPDRFLETDEFIHLRNVQDILSTGVVFEPNPLLPTAAFYPGLAGIAAALVDAAKLEPFVAGLLVMSVARVIALGAVVLVLERILHSSLAAGLGALIYAANPMFLFTASQFSYENLALPLALFATLGVAVVRRRVSWPAAAIVATAIAAVVVTHHVSAFALAGVLMLWWTVEAIAGLRWPGRALPARSRAFLGSAAVAAAVLSVGWFLLVARPASGYLLAGNIVPGLQEAGAMVVGEVAPRELYASGGFSAPLWERVLGWTAVGLLLMGLPFGLLLAWKRRRQPAIVALSLIALTYPLTLAVRLAPSGAVLSGRASPYVYVGLAALLGLLLAVVASGRGRIRAGRSLHRRALVLVAVVTIFIGNVTVGLPFYERLPLPAEPPGYPWTVSADTIEASIWARSHLGPDQIFGAGAIDRLALATYGEQLLVDQESVWPVFFADEMSLPVIRLIRESGLEFVLVNWRMTKAVPPTPGYYFSPWEPGGGQYRQAFPEVNLRKFSNIGCAPRIYDGGQVEIYDLRPILDGGCPSESVAVRP